MNRIYKPYLLLITMTIPQMIIFAVFYRIFYLINSELSKESITMWYGLGSYLAISCGVYTIYSIRNWIQKRDINPYVAVSLFVVNVIFIVVYFIRFSMIIPSSIPNWMLLGIRPGMTVLTLLMPVFAHTMLIVVHWTSENKNINTSKDILYAIGIPFGWYIAMNIITLGRFGYFDALEFLVPIVFVVSGIAFYFFFVRVIYSVLKQKSQKWQSHVAPIVLIGSIAGLMLNQSIGNIFGNFSHYSFYLFAIITGGLLMVPPMEDRKIRLALFIAKSITLIFSLYFFLVFLPYLPLALVGIAAVGLGVLMLTPLVLMLLHVRSLWIDLEYLKSFYSNNVLAVVFLVGIILIPACTITIIGQDKEHLNTALKYTYQRGYEEKTDEEINLSGIRRALDNVKQTKATRRADFFSVFNNKIPYITSFYNWYVLDNLSISNDKMSDLESIFFGEAPIWEEGATLPVEAQLDKPVILKDITNETSYSPEEKAYRSWIHLELKNTREFQSEFTTMFELPEGSYISNYYLYVGDEKKYGLIADKRAANWVYEQSKAVRRDPGILTYLNDDIIDFKIFPFEAREIRKTGIEIVHKSPISLNIEGNILELKDTKNVSSNNSEEIYINKDVVFIPEEIKKKLTQTNRSPEYYFIIDYSKGNEDKIDDYKSRVKDYIEESNIVGSTEEIIALNYVEGRTVHSSEWDNTLSNMDVKGGFNLDYTIKRILYESYVENSKEYPVIVVVSDSLDRAVLSSDFDELSFVSPEGLDYYQLNSSNKLIKHSLLSFGESDQGEHVEGIEEDPVLKWESEEGKTFYIPDNGEDSLVLIDDQMDMSLEDLKTTDWENGVLLEAMNMSYMLHPEKRPEKTLAIVQSSISTNIMSPLTSFIVLENEAQEKVMLEKQKQILSTDKPLDIGDITEMDEPSLLLMVLILVGIYILNKKRKKEKNLM